MVSNSPDMISTLPRISSRAHGRKVSRVSGELPLSFCFLEDLVLLSPFFIHIKLSVGEIASCAFYYQCCTTTRSYHVQAPVVKQDCVLYCD